MGTGPVPYRDRVMTTTRLTISPMSVEECWTELRSVSMGRIGITISALPVILPIFFGVDTDSVVFRSTWGTKLAAATVGSVVAFEADRFDPETDEGWSVVIQGVAREVTGEEVDLLESLLPPKTVTGPDQVYRHVRVTPATITGRWVHR